MTEQPQQGSGLEEFGPKIAAEFAIVPALKYKLRGDQHELLIQYLEALDVSPEVSTELESDIQAAIEANKNFEHALTEAQEIRERERAREEARRKD